MLYSIADKVWEWVECSGDIMWMREMEAGVAMTTNKVTPIFASATVMLGFLHPSPPKKRREREVNP